MSLRLMRDTKRATQKAIYAYIYVCECAIAKKQSKGSLQMRQRKRKNILDWNNIKKNDEKRKQNRKKETAL